MLRDYFQKAGSALGNALCRFGETLSDAVHGGKETKRLMAQQKHEEEREKRLATNKARRGQYSL